MDHIAAIILAAGGSTRYRSTASQPKQLLNWGGKALLTHTADLALAAGFEPVVAVLGASAREVRHALDDRPVQIMINWRWEEGMSTSLHVGLAALPLETEAVVFVLADQPLVTVDLLRTLVTRYRETGRPIIYPTSHDGRRSTPVLFARSLFPQLAAVSGDEGGRSVIARFPKQAATVPVDDPAQLADVDTPADYERLRSQARATHLDWGGIKHLIIDMDGVLWRGDEPLPGLQPFFRFLRQQEVDFVLATNNASRFPQQYVDKLAGFGVQVPIDRVLNSAQASAAYLATIAPAGTPVYPIGGEGVRRALEQVGFVVVVDSAGCVGVDRVDADFVVVGWDPDLTWCKLARAALCIRTGAGFIGTNPDVTYPAEAGPVPGNGAQLAMLEAATGRAPVVIGKPESHMYEEALRRMGAEPATTAVIGDRLDTDIAGGVRLGLATVLLLSGISTQDEVATSPVKPDLVFADIPALHVAWEAALTGQHDK